MSNNNIFVLNSSITRFLVIIASLLIVASLCGNIFTILTGHNNVHGLIPLFYLDAEKNIPTAYSVFLLQFAAILLCSISILKYKQSHFSSYYWIFLFVGFFYMAADEGFTFHERISGPGNFFDENRFHGFLHYAWIIPFMIIIPLLLWFFWEFLKSLPSKTKRQFILAAILYVGGAMGIESIGGYIADTIGKSNLWYYLEVTVEEGLEMFGTIVFIRALLNYLYSNYRVIHIKILTNSDLVFDK